MLVSSLSYDSPSGNFLIFILQALFNYLFMIANLYVFCSLHTYGRHEIVEPSFSLYMEANFLWPSRHFELAMPTDSCLPELEPIKNLII